MLRGRILGTGSYVPEKVLTNKKLEEMVETSDEWITSRTGISERRIATKDTTSELATKAAIKALKDASVSADEIDLVIVATVTPDMFFPSTACFVQSNIGIKRGVPAFDVSAACSGFLYAVDIANRYISSGASRNILVIGVDIFSRIIDWKDRNTCILFGDGAGAIVLSAREGERGILSTHIHSDGRYWKMLYAPSAILSEDANMAIPGKVPYLKMQGNETFKLAVRTMNKACAEALKDNGLSAEDLTLLIPHQANKRIIDAIKERFGLPDEKVYTNLEKYGNTSAGSIPLALDEIVRDGRLKEGDLLLLVAFGGGLTWASALVRW